MFDIDRIVTALRSDPDTRRTATAGAAGVAAGMLLSGGRPGRLIGSALRVGAIAAVGGLAYNAWRNHQQRSGGPDDAPGEDAFVPAPGETAAREELGKSMVRAMIAAAKADGRIDAEEKTRIFARLETMPLSAEEKAWVFDELAGPLDIEAVAAGADTPEHAADVYAASLVAIGGDGEAERAYLEALARRLRLDPGLVAELHRAAEAERVAAP